jgi:hypothetical protein
VKSAGIIKSQSILTLFMLSVTIAGREFGSSKSYCFESRWADEFFWEAVWLSLMSLTFGRTYINHLIPTAALDKARARGLLLNIPKVKP